MGANALASSILDFLHIGILISLFVYLFIKICTIPGRQIIIQLALTVAFFGVCSVLGQHFAPTVVFGLWADIGRLALIIGWLVYIFLEARYVRC